MHIQSYNSQVKFGNVYINSTEAQKNLKKADRIINANHKTDFINTNIPEGHKKPLWSVFSKIITERQSNNPNHIIIDIADKAKQLLSIKTLDANGYTINLRQATPIPTLGTHNEIMPKDDFYQTYYHSLDSKRYGYSEFMDVLDTAEHEVNMLLEKQLSLTPEPQISVRELPKTQNKIKAPNVIRNPRRLEKAKRRFTLHIQRPFEDLKRLMTFETPTTKLAPKNKEKLPRRLKKEIKKDIGI